MYRCDKLMNATFRLQSDVGAPSIACKRRPSCQHRARWVLQAVLGMHAKAFLQAPLGMSTASMLATCARRACTARLPAGWLRVRAVAAFQPVTACMVAPLSSATADYSSAASDAEFNRPASSQPAHATHEASTSGRSAEAAVSAGVQDYVVVNFYHLVHVPEHEQVSGLCCACSVHHCGNIVSACVETLSQCACTRPYMTGGSTASQLSCIT
jgi:hypothetical protein